MLLWEKVQLMLYRSIYSLDRYSKYRSFHTMTTMSEKYGTQVFYKRGLNDEKVGRAIQDFVNSENGRVVKRAYFFLRALYSGFRGNEILHLIPANEAYVQKFKERAQEYDSAFPPKGNVAKLSNIFTKPA
jgi:hypothetical protein